MQITLKAGINSLNVDIAAGATVGEVLSNANYAAVLGFDAGNVEAIIDGALVSPGLALKAGDTVLFQKKAHSKAA